MQKSVLQKTKNRLYFIFGKEKRCNLQKNKIKSGAAFATPQYYLPDKSDSALDLVGTQASGTGIHVARSTVHNGLDPLNIGLPGSVGTSVGVGDLNTKGNALATIITLSHSLHLLSV